MKKETEVNFFKKEKNSSSGVDLGNIDDSQIPVQLKKIMDHLGFLEKKLDTLLEQSRNSGNSRPGFPNRNFSSHRGGSYRPDNRGNRYEGNRPARPGSHSGRPFQKKYAPQSPHTSHAPHAPQGNTHSA